MIRGWDDRALSETVGYVLVFALVVSTVGMITVGGFDSLENRQSIEQVANVERAFDVLSDNVDDVLRHGDRSRATEVRIADGELRIDEPVTVTVGAYDDSTGFAETNETLTVHPIVYEVDDRQVIYGLGAIFRSDGEASAMTHPPSFVEDDGTVSMALLDTRAAPGREIAVGPTTALVVADASTAALPTSSIHEPNGDHDDLAVRIESSRPAMWAEPFERSGFEPIERSDDTIVLTAAENGPDRVVLSTRNVFLSIED